MNAPPQNPTLAQALRDWWRQNAAEQGTIATLRCFCAELWGFVRDSTPEQRRRRYGDVEYDWDYRVDTTSATVGWRDRLLGVFHSPYQPTEPALFHEMLAQLQADLSDYTFIDIGSGKGRTLLMASDYPFRRIIGVELLPELDRVARENIRRYKSDKQKCIEIESCCLDARSFPFPEEPTVLYLFNPLPRAGLSQVLDNLERSLIHHPRKFCVLYHNPLHIDLFANRSWLKHTRSTHQYSAFESTLTFGFGQDHGQSDLP